MLVRKRSSCCDNGDRLTKKPRLLFQAGKKLVVQRAPLMEGLTVASKPFQRPMLQRRAYGKPADAALHASTLGPRKRCGMAKLLARAGKGLAYKAAAAIQSKNNSSDTEDSSGDEDDNAPRPFEPLCLWQSPHQHPDVQPKGLPPRRVTLTRPDDCGVNETVTVLQPATHYSKQDVYVPSILAQWLRPHQREGVQFLYECVMGLRDYLGQGCILADDMGLGRFFFLCRLMVPYNLLTHSTTTTGKTLQSLTLIYTLLKTGITDDGAPTAKRVVVVCPCSLVKNWDHEFVKWLGPNTVKVLALAEADRKYIEKSLESFAKTKIFNVLICSYECLRTHVKRLTKYPDCCDLLVCDEAHRLKNADNQTSRALNSLPCRRRILLTGTPMQNDLQEFYAMVDFTNPGILGTPEDFRRQRLFPILRGREPDATDAQKRKMMEIQNDMSRIVNDFILRRVNTLNAQHLPPKLVQVVCCNLTDIQKNMYQHLVSSKDLQHMVDGKQVNCLSSIQMLMKLANHPSLVAAEETMSANIISRRTGKAAISYADDDDTPSSAAPGAQDLARFLPSLPSRNSPVHPEWSGKMLVLYLLMKEMRAQGNDKIVIVSNYTQTLDLIGKLCSENHWGFCRLDGSIGMKKRQKMVDDFNNPSSSLIAFLLSSKAGGWCVLLRWISNGQSGEYNHSQLVFAADSTSLVATDWCSSIPIGIRPSTSKRRPVAGVMDKRSDASRIDSWPRGRSRKRSFSGSSPRRACNPSSTTRNRSMH